MSFVSLALLQLEETDSRMLRADCTDNEQYFRLDLRTDNYGYGYVRDFEVTVACY